MIDEATEIRRVASYNSDTGEFVWIVARGRARAGSPVGGVWLNKGRHEVTFIGHRCQVARLIWLWMTGEWPKHGVDHKDGNPLNCRWVNLRDVPQSANVQNQRRAHRDKKGLLGAHKTRAGRWAAAICVARKQIHLGLFDTAEQAHTAYLGAKRKVHEGCTI